MNKKIDKFENFMNGFVAATQLLQRAGEKGFFIEYTCLSASIIDGLLRIGLILKHQLETKTDEIDESLLYQTNEDRIIPERKIYQIALEKTIISQELFDKLEELYKKRNRVIHRYIISNISTREVLNIGIKYEEIRSSVSDAVKKLEDEQIETGIGMTKTGKDKPEPVGDMLKRLNDMSAKKHDDNFLNKALKNKS